MPVGTMKTDYTEQSVQTIRIHKRNNKNTLVGFWARFLVLLKVAHWTDASLSAAETCVSEDISLICDNSVTTQNLCFFSGETFKDFECALLFYECDDDTAALQRRVLQTAL
jgi:hypothetical protein